MTRVYIDDVLFMLKFVRIYSSEDCTGYVLSRLHRVRNLQSRILHILEIALSFDLLRPLEMNLPYYPNQINVVSAQEL